MKLLLTKHKHYARIVFMFQEKYKHHSRQPKNSFARIASKVTSLFKRDNTATEAVNVWVI